MTTQPKKNSSWQFFLLQLPFWSAVLLLVVTALLVLVLRFFVPKADMARPYLETWLSEQFPFDLKISYLTASLFKIDPALAIDQLSLSNHGQDFLVIKDIYLELDTLATLLAGAPRMKDARLAGLELWVEETPDGWQLQGWQENQAALYVENDASETVALSAEEGLQKVFGYIEQLLEQGELDFSDLRINFTPLDDEPLFFSAESMSYRRWSEGRQFSFQLQSSTEATQPAALVVTLAGEVFDIKTSHLSAWFNLPLISLDDFQALWSGDLQETNQNFQGQFSLEGWLSFQQGQLQLDLQVRDVELLHDQLWQVKFDKADITLQGTLDNWSADWRMSHLRSNHYFFDELAGRVGQENNASYLQLEELKLGTFIKQLIQDTNLPNSARQLIKDLSPSGSLKNILLTYDAAGEVELQANLYDVSVNDWEGAPQGAGLHGWLQADAQGGQVVFADHPLQLSFPKLYSTVWDFTHAKGVVSWELEGSELWVVGKNLAVTLPVQGLPAASTRAAHQVQVSGEFAYFYGPNDQRFYLNLGLLPVVAAAHKQLVPDKLLEPELMTWLNSALLAGQVKKAGFIYAGPITSKANGETSTFQVVTDFVATDFKFQPDWPYLSAARGSVQVFDGWVKGRVKNAQFNTGQLSNATFATGLNKQGELILDIATDITTPLALFPWLVKNSPLQTQIPEPLHEWQYLGQLAGNLNLSIPLGQADLLPSVTLKSEISNAELTLSQVDLTLTEINGPLNFTLDKGLESKGLKGKFMGQPVKAMFTLEPENRLSFTADVTAENLKKHFQLPAALELKGATQLQGELPLAPFGILALTSDLEGLGLNLPLPWRKASLEKRKLTMQLDFSNDELPLRLQLADQLDFITHIYNPEKGSCLQLAEEQVPLASLPNQPGLWVAVAVKQLNAEPVYTWLNTLNSSPAVATQQLTFANQLQGLNRLQLKVDELSWNEFNLEQSLFTLKPSKEGLVFNFATALSVGEVWLPIQPEQQWVINISHLHLPVAEPEAVNEELNKEANKTPKRLNYQPKFDVLKDYNPQNLPTAFLTIDDLAVGKKRLGKVTAQLNALQQGVRLDPLHLDLEQSHLVATFDWIKNAQGHASYLEGKITGKNLADALIAATHENKPLLVSEKHQLGFIANWQGSPLAFDLQTVNAKLQLELKNGYFPKTDARLSGVTQVLGLLNMDTLLRRLRLDFADLTSKGISYNSIKGQYQLENGYLKTSEPTRIVSSATRMSLTGKVDLIEETLDQQLLIVMPVAQSLPVAAVLAGAPHIGAAIWVVQKIFSNLFDTFTEVRYKVSGPLADPKVELQSVF